MLSDAYDYEFMGSTDFNDTADLISALKLKDPEASAVLFERIYDQLRSMASARLRWRKDSILQPTALVNEAWLKLESNLGGVRNRGHFLALAGLAMRQILSDRARAGRAQRRDHHQQGGTVEVAGAEGTFEALDLIALDDALTKLATLNARHARVVELRFLASLSIEETAQALGISTSTVDSDWAMAVAWLRVELAR